MPRSLPEKPHVTVSSVAALLRGLASRARRLPPPSARRPEAFHEARDELAQDLNVVATVLEEMVRLERR